MLKQFSIVVIFYLLCLYASSQVKYELLNTNQIAFTKVNEMRWWEWKITNDSCDSTDVSFSIALEDTLGLTLHPSFNNQVVKDSIITLSPGAQESLILYCTLNSSNDQQLKTFFSAKKKDTSFGLRAVLDPLLLKTHHCFPTNSTGLFRIHTGNLDHPQVMVMNSSRQLLLENSSGHPFLKLNEYPSGEYIIQIGEDEFIVNKVSLLDSN